MISIILAIVLNVDNKSFALEQDVSEFPMQNQFTTLKLSMCPLLLVIS